MMMNCMMKRKMRMVDHAGKAAGTMVLGTVMILIMLALQPMKVSGSAGNEMADREYYHGMEMTFLEVLDTKLQECGYGNCGITMRSVMELDGERTYYVQLYHKNIVNMEDAEWEILLAELSQLSFPAKRCNICYEMVR